MDSMSVEEVGLLPSVGEVRVLEFLELGFASGAAEGPTHSG